MRLVADPVQLPTVEDADDQNPVFSQESYKAVLLVPGLAGSILSVLPGTLEAADRDLGLNSLVYYSWARVEPLYRLISITYLKHIWIIS